ncbi:CASP8-associated protein 2 isoform X2 [Bufo bufo]|uniref:CASP8-associated protein 2 isoform X2 n=1 Tax=Bufo bufo TaxID=8384 RepID=UPI001ABEDA09|nr:CASP8-associated protein 2 isoform X2 [Bufo bufo]
MDGQMALKQEHGNENRMHFQDFFASPAKSDASSVDIYDGLDMVTSTDQVAETGSPSRNCLDLYEELLTEEGTAKEASFNDLSAEYENCQKQMKQLIAKMKEMQSLNSSLQNENQCLKKNISALIKTARVEITRKEEEINRLTRRPSGPGRNHSFKLNPLPLRTVKTKSNNVDHSNNIRYTETLPKKAIPLQSKDLTSCNSKNLSEKTTCMESSQTSTPKNPIAKESKESPVYHSQERGLEPPRLEVNDKNSKEVDLDSQTMDTERSRTKERPRCSFSNSVNERSDLKEKTHKSSPKCGENESSQENRNSKTEVGCGAENHKYHSSSTKEKTQVKDLEYSKEKQVKKHERSPHRRESRAHEKEKNTESRHRTDKNEEPRRSKRTPFSKDNSAQKISELSDGKRSSDVSRKDNSAQKISELSDGKRSSDVSRKDNSAQKISELSDGKRSSDVSRKDNSAQKISELSDGKRSSDVSRKNNSAQKISELSDGKRSSDVSRKNNSAQKISELSDGKSSDVSRKDNSVQKISELSDGKRSSDVSRKDNSAQKISELSDGKRSSDVSRKDNSAQKISELSDGKSSDVSRKDNSAQKISELSDGKRSSDVSRKDNSAQKISELSDGKRSSDVSRKDNSAQKISELSDGKRSSDVSRKNNSAQKISELSDGKRSSDVSRKDNSAQKISELSDGKRSSDASRKDKRSSEYNESKHEKKDSKPSKSENSTRNMPSSENKTERSDRDRRGDENKRSRDEQARSRNDRNDKGHRTKEKDMHLSPSKDKGLHSKISDKGKSREKVKEDSIQKDLKLSFMETLNLTLSPAKKTSDTQQVVSGASSMECEVEGKVAEGSSQLCVIEDSTDSLHPQKTDLKPSEHVSMDNNTTKEDTNLVSQFGPVVDHIVCLNEQQPSSTVEENSELLAELTLDDKQAGSTVLDTVSAEVKDTHSLVDDSEIFDLDSFIEIDRCSGSPSDTPNVSVPAEQSEDDGSVLKQSEDADNQAIKLKSSLTETPKGICETPRNDFINVIAKGSENKPCFHDEGSIDLNSLRHIPKVLSPLKSPVRPKAQHTLERTAKASVVSVLYKESLPETNAKPTCLLVSEDLNKENCQPDNKSDFGSKIPAVTSTDEVEEGETVSEDEQFCKQTIQSKSSPDQVTSVNKSQSGQDSELLFLPKPETLTTAQKKSTKSKTKIDKQAALSTSKRKKESADSCLDGILKIVTPSSIQDVLQMLRIIRKHIRKKYMKFKIQFSLNQFHRVIERAALYFVSLVRSLDWSSLCSLPERLQKKLCKHIETRLRMLKKNGIVVRIFDQSLIDMKTSLWKFVDEQLDSLFDILKAVLLKLCDKAEVEKNIVSCTNTQKSDPVENSRNKRCKNMDKVCLRSSGSMPCLRRLEFHNQATVTNPNNENTVLHKELVKELTGIGFNSENVDIPSSNVSSTSEPPHVSPSKSFASNAPCPKSQLNSSGLSFNLVSDDHMGDVFKSLLHNSDNLPSNTLIEDEWILETPKKTASSSKKFENVDSLSENKTPTKSAFSWSSISPPHMHTFSRLDTVLNPDVFDENCLLEVPTSSSSIKTLSGSEDRLKSYSSVLMEDLAVSLTLPSPLKSDSHLSFLRPFCDTEPISKLDVKYCEGSFLDELTNEDATEQDIHLTLDSDNSSTGSSEDTGQSGSFQYHPSEPMQAVIMEKSNDHFIVKIRRAVSSSSPVCDSSSEGTDNTVPESLQTVDGNKPEMETRLDTMSEAHNGSIQLHPNPLHLTNLTDNYLIDLMRPDEVSVPDESVFKLPPSRSHLESPAAMKRIANYIVEHSEISCEKSVTSCIEETCNAEVPADILPKKTSDAGTVDLNLKKKRKSLDEEPSAKRKKTSPPDEDKGTKHYKTESLLLEKADKKRHTRAVSDGAINFHSSKVSPTNLSAKNVIKKKGEVVISWTRDEDRTILLECQRLGPTKKTFIFLSSSMNKYPHQVEERFRQLMKLFKKSRNSSS